MLRRTVPTVSLIAGLILACAGRAVLSTDAPGSIVDLPTSDVSIPLRLQTQYLPNVVRVHSKVLSGGLPEGEEAFDELVELGVRTIISVDGAIPDVGAAKKAGMAYVHLPHGYDGIPDERVNELAKAVRDLDGPIYIHCHHGKHRSPAATSVACVSAGLISPSRAVTVLEVAGTDPHYVGLYQSARNARPLATRALDELDADFKQQCDVPPLAEAMVQLSHTHDDLKRLSRSDWLTPAVHPDLDAVYVAVLLKEHFAELLRTEAVQNRPADFRLWLHQSRDAALKIEQALSQWSGASAEKIAPDVLQTCVKQIEVNCQSCHAKYRDVPETTGR